eukprot:8930343-Pyramimonas_sp.AAC.1
MFDAIRGWWLVQEEEPYVVALRYIRQGESLRVAANDEETGSDDDEEVGSEEEEINSEEGEEEGSDDEEVGSEEGEEEASED